MRRLIASATLFLLLLPTVAFAAPPDRDPAGSPEYEEFVILLLGPVEEVEPNEGEPAPNADEPAADGSDGNDGRGPR